MPDRMNDDMNNRIVFIDDEKNILNALKRLFHKDSYEMFFFDDPKKAMEEFGNINPAVIVSDQRMPGMSGSRLFETARLVCPDAIRLILTGYTDMATAIESINLGHVNRFISKPWDDEQLREEIKNAVLMYHLEKEKLSSLISSTASRQGSIERKKGIAQLAGAVCNEIDKPLQIAIGLADILAGETAGSELKPFADSIKKELGKIYAIMKKVMLIKYESSQSSDT